MNDKNKFFEIVRISKENFDPDFKSHELLPRMILLSYFNEIIDDYDEENANDDLKGLKTNDGGLDAFVVDDNNKNIYLCQFKTAESLARINDFKIESKDISYLSTFSKRINDSEWVKDKNNQSIKQIASEYNDLVDKGYKVKKLFFAFCYKEKGNKKVNEFKSLDIQPIFFEEIYEKICSFSQKISDEDIKGEYFLESAKYKERQGSKEIYFKFQNFRPHDSDPKRESFVGIVSASSLIKILEEEGNKLFENNVRYYLGSSSVNKEMRKTLVEEPEKFYYYNNGITLICNEAKIQKRDSHDGYNENNHEIRLTDPQIINGAQTVNSIWSAYKEDQEVRKKIDKVAILCKIIQTKNSPDFRIDLQRYTNSSNPVKEIDFISNNIEQKLIEEFFKENKVFYQRKRGLKEGDSNRIQWKKKFKTSPKELAQTLIAWDGEPANSKNDSKSVFAIHNGELTQKYYKVFRSDKETKTISKDSKKEMLVANFFYKVINEMIKSFANYYKNKDKNDKPNWLTIEDSFIEGCHFITEGKFHILSFIKFIIDSHSKKDEILNSNPFPNQLFIEKICEEWISDIIMAFESDYSQESENNKKVNSKTFFKTNKYYEAFLNNYKKYASNHKKSIVNSYKWPLI